jgi:hypothetical protein
MVLLIMDPPSCPSECCVHGVTDSCPSEYCVHGVTDDPYACWTLSLYKDTLKLSCCSQHLCDTASPGRTHWLLYWDDGGAQQSEGV